jgi:hypothetical protein
MSKLLSILSSSDDPTSGLLPPQQLTTILETVYRYAPIPPGDLPFLLAQNILKWANKSAPYVLSLHTADFSALTTYQRAQILALIPRLSESDDPGLYRTLHIFSNLAHAAIATQDITLRSAALHPAAVDAAIKSIDDAARNGRMAPRAVEQARKAMQDSLESLQSETEVAFEELDRVNREFLEVMRRVGGAAGERREPEAAQASTGNFVEIHSRSKICRYVMKGGGSGQRLQGFVSGEWRELDTLCDGGTHEFTIGGAGVSVQALRQSPPGEASWTVVECPGPPFQVRFGEGTNNGSLCIVE